MSVAPQMAVAAQVRTSKTPAEPEDDVQITELIYACHSYLDTFVADNETMQMKLTQTEAVMKKKAKKRRKEERRRKKEKREKEKSSTT